MFTKITTFFTFLRSAQGEMFVENTNSLCKGLRIIER